MRGTPAGARRGVGGKVCSSGALRSLGNSKAERDPMRVPFAFVIDVADYQPTFFWISTLLPITAPRIPPTPAPIKPPFTLSRLVVAPMIAPAAAPIAASRAVCFTVVVGAGPG